MSITKLYTADDLLAMDADAPFELIEGELSDMPPSEGRASYIGGNLFGPLQTFVRKHRLGFATMEGGGYILGRSPDTVVAPDIGFVRRERLPDGPPANAYIPIPPDLAVEVISHTDRYPSVVRKAHRYLETGTRLVWIVRPDQKSIVVLAIGREPQELSSNDVLDGEDEIPGFSLPVAELFE